MSRIMLNTSKFIAPRLIGTRAMSGGKDGAIREAGGAFGKIEAAREEDYFLRMQRIQLEQLSHLKEDKIKKDEYLKKQIQEHEDAIKRYKEELTKIQK